MAWQQSLSVLRLRVDHRDLQKLSRDLGLRSSGSLVNPAGAKDPVLLNLARALHAKEIIAAHLLGDISIDEVASQCRLSRRHFIGGFFEATGKTPYQWLFERRIDVVKSCLAENRSPFRRSPWSAGSWTRAT